MATIPTESYARHMPVNNEVDEWLTSIADNTKAIKTMVMELHTITGLSMHSFMLSSEVLDVTAIRNIVNANCDLRTARERVGNILQAFKAVQLEWCAAEARWRLEHGC